MYTAFLVMKPFHHALQMNVALFPLWICGRSRCARCLCHTIIQGSLYSQCTETHSPDIADVRVVSEWWFDLGDVGLSETLFSMVLRSFNCLPFSTWNDSVKTGQLCKKPVPIRVTAEHQEASDLLKCLSHAAVTKVFSSSPAGSCHAGCTEFYFKFYTINYSK